MHQSSNINNLYKFRNQEALGVSERPRTSNGVLRSNSSGHNADDVRGSKGEAYYQPNEEKKSIENALQSEVNKKQSRANRPLSGGGPQGI